MTESNSISNSINRPKDIEGKSFTDREKLLNRIDELDDDFADPVYIEPKKEPETFRDRIKAFTFKSIFRFIQKLTTLEARLNLNEFLNGESDQLLLKVKVYVMNQRIIKRSIKLL